MYYRRQELKQIATSIKPSLKFTLNNLDQFLEKTSEQLQLLSYNDQRKMTLAAVAHIGETIIEHKKHYRWIPVEQSQNRKMKRHAKLFTDDICHLILQNQITKKEIYLGYQVHSVLLRKNQAYKLNVHFH